MLAGSTVAFAASQGQEQDKHTQHQNVQHQNAAQHSNTKSSNTKSSNTKNQGNERKTHADQRKGQTAKKSPAQVKKSVSIKANISQVNACQSNTVMTLSIIKSINFQNHQKISVG